LLNQSTDPTGTIHSLGWPVTAAYPIEVGVAVKDGQAAGLRRRDDQEIGAWPRAGAGAESTI
jgi:hypothetical protein